MTGQYWSNVQYFNPKQISNLQVWLDATDPAANGVVPANGSSLASWVDKSGKGNNVSQGTGASQPVFLNPGTNGKPVLTFNSAAPQSLAGTISGLAANPNLSTYMVVQSATLVGNPVVHGIGSGTANFQSIGIGINSGLFIAFEWGGNDQSFNPANTNYNVLQYNYRTATSSISLLTNGLVNTSASGVAGALTLNTAFTLGLHSRGGTASWNGTIAELLIYNKAVTAAENALIYNYISKKWGL